MNHWNTIYSRDPKTYSYYDLTTAHPDLAGIAMILKQSGARSVLDLGCGSGRNLFYLLDQGFRVSGIDIAPAGIALIRKQLKQKDKNRCALKRGDIFAKLPYKDASFDAVVSVQVLQHSTEKSIQRAITEIERVLRPEGFLFVTLCGRLSKGKVRYCLVKTAKKIAPRTYIPTIGDEKRLNTFIYDKKTLMKHYRNFRLIKLFRDANDYYCFFGQKKITSERA